MEGILGLLRIRLKRGRNLAVRDLASSDPYVSISMGHQKLKTRVVKNNCNPEWNDEVTLSISDLNFPINLTVYDKDTFTGDDKMGEACIDVQPYVSCLKMGLQDLATGTVISRVQPTEDNCLADESCITWIDGKIVQDMNLRLRNVECGEVEVQIEWIHVQGSRGLETEESSDASFVRVL